MTAKVVLQNSVFFWENVQTKIDNCVITNK